VQSKTVPKIDPIEKGEVYREWLMIDENFLKFEFCRRRLVLSFHPSGFFVVNWKKKKENKPIPSKFLLFCLERIIILEKI
jgi:hypothetical protein